MFTGIIETIAEIKEIEQQGTNFHFLMESSISSQLHVDQSVSHDGVCLTVTEIASNRHKVTAVKETLEKTNLGMRKIGDSMNLERCMVANGRFDGHIVQGHVDGLANISSIQDQKGSWLYTFKLEKPTKLLVEKGSVCVNGVSLTCFSIVPDGFQIAVIPYTYEHTTFCRLHIGDSVNIEFDIIGKYVARLLQT